MVSETDMRRHTVLTPTASTGGNSNGNGNGNGNGNDNDNDNGNGNGNGNGNDDDGDTPLPRAPSTQRQQKQKQPPPRPPPPPIGDGTAEGTPSQLPSRESESAASRPDTPPVQRETNKHRRFSVLRFRNASDSQLSLRAKQQAEKPPPVPRRTYTSPVPLLAVSALPVLTMPHQPPPSSPPPRQTTSRAPGRWHLA